MKLSVPGKFILLTLCCAPLFLAGKMANLPKDDHGLRKMLPVGAETIPNNYFTFSDLLYSNIHLDQFGLSRQVFQLAMKGFDRLMKSGQLNKDSILTIVDFSKSSREKRLVVIDLKEKEVLVNTVVAHGRNTGQEFARSFSNLPRSNKSSIGFYITRSTYMGSNGYSLKLDGYEAGFNDNAMRRAIVMHGADYANEGIIGKKGFLGRSLGCPAVPDKYNRKIIDRIKNGNCLFVYYPDQKYLKTSRLLNG